MQNIDKKLLRKALEYLGELLDKHGLQCKICLYGGSALIFLTDFREMSNDVDYRIIEINKQNIIDAHTKNIFSLLVFEVAEKMGFDIDWMNRAVEAFVSKNEEYSYSESFANNALTVLIPSLECILAMKCVAMRDYKDVDDIKNIVKKIGLKSVDQIIEIVNMFYPRQQVALDIIIKLEDICGEKNRALPS